MSLLPRAYGESVLRARFRSVPEDFIVEEIPAFEASGEGEHLLLNIEKRGMNTAFAAKQIARWAGIAEMGVGYAGLKDRQALTRQRFSVHLPKRVMPDIDALQSDELRVLDVHWHARKLPRGALAGNRFTLLLRDVVADPAAVSRRLQAIAEGGLPNYFGEQRFGRDGDNVESARRMFAGARVRREQRSIYLSAARSLLFNTVLSERIRAGKWQTGMAGDVWMLDGTQSVFGPEPLTPALQERRMRQDIHSTGPLWGRGDLRSQDEVLALEQAAVAPFQDIRQGLEEAGLKQERRALRVRVQHLEWHWPQTDELALVFQLPPGAYATEVLAELGDVSA